MSITVTFEKGKFNAFDRSFKIYINIDLFIGKCNEANLLVHSEETPVHVLHRRRKKGGGGSRGASPPNNLRGGTTYPLAPPIIHPPFPSISM